MYHSKHFSATSTQNKKLKGTQQETLNLKLSLKLNQLFKKKMKF